MIRPRALLRVSQVIRLNRGGRIVSHVGPALRDATPFVVFRPAGRVFDVGAGMKVWGAAIGSEIRVAV